MESKGSSKEQKGKKMGHPLPKTPSVSEAQQVIDYLTETLGVAPTMLAGLLQVTERTLLNWRDKTLDELSENPKSRRLLDLDEFVRQAEKKNVRKRLMLNLLHEPIDPKNEESSSILHYIVRMPSSALLKETAPLIIEKFLADSLQ